jgi:hypothetical protein
MGYEENEWAAFLAHYERLKRLKNAVLVNILRRNNQVMGGKKWELVERVADGMVQLQTLTRHSELSHHANIALAADQSTTPRSPGISVQGTLTTRDKYGVPSISTSLTSFAWNGWTRIDLVYFMI